MNPNIPLIGILAIMAGGCVHEPHMHVDTGISFTKIDERTPVQDSTYRSQYVVNPDPNPLMMSDFTFKKDELQGCAYSFSETDANPSGDRYLFVRKNDGTAYISLSGGLRTLTLVSKPRRAGATEHSFREVYRTGLFKITLSVSFVEKDSDGISHYEGTITCESHNGQRDVRNITGECGC